MSFLDKSEHIDIRCRNLPHWHQEGRYQFVTFHQADSIPKGALDDLIFRRKRWIAIHPEPWSAYEKTVYRMLFNEQTDSWLDSGYGTCVLKDKELARIVSDALEYFNGTRYIIHAYVVMSNHVHVLFELLGSIKVSQICKSWKNFTALTINRRLDRQGQFWHHESWDRLIRDRAHYDTVISYIEKNIRLGGVIWRVGTQAGSR